MKKYMDSDKTWWLTYINIAKGNIYDFKDFYKDLTKKKQLRKVAAFVFTIFLLSN